MLKKLINWLLGYLCIHIDGIAPERFINLCNNRKIYVWDLRRTKEVYQFYISTRDYKNLKPIARKTGIIPKIFRKFGFPFLMHRYKKRKGFFAGVLICIILIYILSLYVWDISVVGGSKYTSEAMIKFLKNHDITTGDKKNSVNCQEIEETIRLTYNDIGWVSAEMKGTRLIIKITETNMPAPAQVAVAPSHIVATKNGIIKNIITRTGSPMVREGYVVKKGDIIISGILNIVGDFDLIIRKEPVVADADVICNSYYDYYEKFPMKYKDKLYTSNQKKGYYITLFNKKLFLYNRRYSYDNYDIIVNEKTLQVTRNFYLPFCFGSITTREYEEQEKTYTHEEAIEIAKAKLQRYFDRLIEKDVLITDHNVTITIEDNMCIAQGRILVEEQAWEYRTIQENEWRIEETDELNGDNN